MTASTAFYDEPFRRIADDRLSAYDPDADVEWEDDELLDPDDEANWDDDEWDDEWDELDDDYPHGDDELSTGKTQNLAEVRNLAEARRRKNARAGWKHDAPTAQDPHWAEALEHAIEILLDARWTNDWNTGLAKRRTYSKPWGDKLTKLLDSEELWVPVPAEQLALQFKSAILYISHYRQLANDWAELRRLKTKRHDPFAADCALSNAVERIDLRSELLRLLRSHIPASLVKVLHDMRPLNLPYATSPDDGATGTPATDDFPAPISRLKVA